MGGVVSRLSWIVLVGSASCTLAYPLDELIVGSGGTTATGDVVSSSSASGAPTATTGTATASASVVSSSSASGTGGAPGCAPDRTSTDRPDDVAGYQIHVNYVLPSDGIDESLDVNGRIAISIQAVQQWISDEMGQGRSLRFDTCDGELDVRFLRLATSEAVIKSQGILIRDAIEAEMVALDAVHPQKLEIVYYGGDAQDSCGSAPRPPSLIGRVAGIYLKGTYADPLIPGCATNPVGLDPQQMGYIEKVAIHESLHALGFLSACAPNVDANAHATDVDFDVMWAGSFATAVALDVNRDDYFEHGNVGCPDLARSSFVEPLPQAHEPPPGW